MDNNPQSGSTSSSSGPGHFSSSGGKRKTLPPLFYYMELGDWEKATERARKHPREVKTWATLRTKSQANETVSGTKRLALHHACFKLRTVPTLPAASTPSTNSTEGDDNFVEVCKFILLLTDIYPEAAGMRESRHGCLPLHLAAFASCAPRAKDDPSDQASISSEGMASDVAKGPAPAGGRSSSLNPPVRKPETMQRSVSDSTQNTANTAMSAVLAEESYTGAQTTMHRNDRRSLSPHVDMPPSPEGRDHSAIPVTAQSPNVSVSLKSNVLISVKREEMAVKVIDALLDAYPKAIKIDSEGGRLPLHTSCAGRATPRVISTLVQAYPAAARHRNKDGFLPLHLAAHWGVSHPNVAIIMCKAYPDATLGRNRWERTPLEEALCMAGENGRPHQAALVRCLRKHPSYWSAPTEELYRSTTLNGRIRSQIVDMDDTVADDDDTSTDGDLEVSGVIRKLPTVSGDADLGTLIKKTHWPAVLQRLQANPHEAGETLNAVTKGGFVPAAGCTPLHYACERRPPAEVVSALVEAWPEAVTTRMQPGGTLPLHVACTWHASSNVVSVLIHADPSTCRAADDLGNLSLHHAAFSGATAPVIDTLLRTYSKAVLARNHQGSLPEDIVKRLRHDNRKNVLALLSSRKDEARHRRARSAGNSVSATAQRAMELNLRNGTPRSPRASGSPRGHSSPNIEEGVEVTIDGDGDSEMMWI